jgi:hypothetical protein
MDGGDPRRPCPGRVVRIRWCGAKHSRRGVAVRSRVVERGHPRRLLGLAAHREKQGRPGCSAWVRPPGSASVPQARSGPGPLAGVVLTRACAWRRLVAAAGVDRHGWEKNSAAGPTRQRAGAKRRGKVGRTGPPWLAGPKGRATEGSRPKLGGG